MQDAVTMVLNIQDAEEAAKRLTEEAYKKGSADNITCVVIRFHHVSYIDSGLIKRVYITTAFLATPGHFLQLYMDKKWDFKLF
jgi:serine/threonine protein phosphatase PrpC